MAVNKQNYRYIARNFKECVPQNILADTRNRFLKILLPRLEKLC
jgi:hypothetical protein